MTPSSVPLFSSKTNDFRRVQKWTHTWGYSIMDSTNITVITLIPMPIMIIHEGRTKRASVHLISYTCWFIPSEFSLIILRELWDITSHVLTIKHISWHLVWLHKRRNLGNKRLVRKSTSGKVQSSFFCCDFLSQIHISHLSPGQKRITSHQCFA